MTQDNPHNEMPKDIVEELVDRIEHGITLMDCGQMSDIRWRDEVYQALTTAYNKGVEVGSKGTVDKNRRSLTSQYNPLLNQDMIISALHATMKRVDELQALTPLPEFSL